jgi:hypothetical protein
MDWLTRRRGRRQKEKGWENIRENIQKIRDRSWEKFQYFNIIQIGLQSF